MAPRDFLPDYWSSALWPLGAHVDGDTTSFSVQAPAATRVVVEIFDAATGVDASHRTVLAQNPADGIWRARVGGVGHGAYYGFRAWGSAWPFDEEWRPGGTAGFVDDLDAAGNRFNPNKLLLDPYGREISHTQHSALVTADGQSGAMFDGGDATYGDGPARAFDTARWAPKSIVIHDSTPTGARPEIAPEDRLIYEAHVKFLTAHPTAARLGELLASTPGFEGVGDVPDELRGTYLGAARWAPYLKALGFTTVELLPVQENSSSDAPASAGQRNAWGYMTIGFFAPSRAYAYDRSPGGPTREFKEMVRAFHDAGLQVYSDVVYNHTGEGGNVPGNPGRTSFCSFGGLATADYYVLTPDHQLVDGATGCGNQINVSSAITTHLITDSLMYWVKHMGIDGFRFDLAPVLGRLPDAAPRGDWDAQRRFFRDSPLLNEIAAGARSLGLAVIAEAWDLWGYEVGDFPEGWAEWNGHFRDAVRQFAKGAGNADALMRTLNGDYRLYADQGGPALAVNFVDAHDGFTMADLASYNGKLNGQPWPFGPTDGGSDSNDSWDSGGDAALRRQRIRNFWTLLLLSRGVPMVVAGDEYGRTQNGNNNPWSLDSPGVWNNWAQAVTNAPDRVPVDPAEPDWAYHDNLGVALTPSGVNPILPLARFLTWLRASHQGLRQAHYGDVHGGGDGVSYLYTRPDGSSPHDGDRALRLVIDAHPSVGPNLVVLINMAASFVDFALPQPEAGASWVLLADTATWAEPTGNHWAPEEASVISGHYQVHAWSVAVLIEHGPGALPLQQVD